MNLLDVFRKSRKTFAPNCLGSMWACAVKFEPDFKPGRRYGVAVKNVGVVEAFVRDGETRVASGERDPFGDGTFGNLAGPVGRLEYFHSSHMWIGFFETEDEAKEGYRRFADTLVAEIKSASAGLGVAGETGQSPSA
jgi:hypothetical protein